MERPSICPFCGRPAGDEAARCASCGAPYDLDRNFAVGLERIANQRSMARAILVAGMAWWVVEILRVPTIGSILLPAAISFIAFAELSYIAVVKKRLQGRREREIRSASARQKRSDEAAKAPGLAAAAAELPRTEPPGSGPPENESPRTEPPESPGLESPGLQ